MIYKDDDAHLFSERVDDCISILIGLMEDLDRRKDAEDSKLDKDWVKKIQKLSRSLIKELEKGEIDLL